MVITMDEPIFSGSSEITRNELKEAAEMAIFGNITGTIIKVTTGVMIALAVLFLLIPMLPSSEISPATAFANAASMLVIPVFTAVFKGRAINGRVNAPINQNIHAEVRLYENSLSYSTEYVTLSAGYSDVKKLHIGKCSAVLEFDGADSITIPFRCFGWNNYQSACEFLRKKINEQGADI